MAGWLCQAVICCHARALITLASDTSLQFALTSGSVPYYAPSPTGRREERERALTRRLKRLIQKWKKSGP